MPGRRGTFGLTIENVRVALSPDARGPAELGVKDIHGDMFWIFAAVKFRMDVEGPEFEMTEV